MIKEEYVTLETAKYLKRAGFDIPCKRCFLINGLPACSGQEENHNHVTRNAYSRPTQGLAARWIREKFKIHIFTWYDGKEDYWIYGTIKIEKDSDPEFCVEVNAATCEKAMETGLQDVLYYKILPIVEYEKEATGN